MTYRFTKKDINCTHTDNGYLMLSIVLDNQYYQRSYMFYPKQIALRKFQEELGTFPSEYRNKPIATYGVCNHGGLAIFDIEHGIDDYVYVMDNYGDGYKNLTKNRICYNTRGKAYFTRNRQRYYLNDFMRVS